MPSASTTSEKTRKLSMWGPSSALPISCEPAAKLHPRCYTTVPAGGIDSFIGGTSRDYLNKDIFWVIIVSEVLDVNAASTETCDLLVVLGTAIEMREQTNAPKSTSLLNDSVAEERFRSGSLFPP